MPSPPTLRPSAAEFPHDNPLFERGALWHESALSFTAAPAVIEEPTAPTESVSTHELPVANETAITASTATATPTATPLATAPVATPEAPARLHDAPPPIVAPVECDIAPGPPPPGTEQPPETDPITVFVRAVTEVALAHGPAETAVQFESLFHFGTLDADALSAPAQAALFDGRILETTDAGIRPTEWFASMRIAWQGLLRGESGDLSACGESTLDTWTADLVARLVAHPDRAQSIRRDLRRKGIAAFGMLS
jgi:hypothetical protein